ncbi:MULTISPECIES: lysophospholipid acyltransferase family protein [unclassified Candidatus Frackibacter]|uniref:lysophospholipid acyltransferase family protein n=1 Tax=unclassified Candidatus Frackibacter TaxID=2648818 RepID=UPI00087F40CE|nr:MULTISPECIES: lysophospholipid acyltransferase family protein [unclassified Candidatus Frackibacter]SDC09216.1 KDO2-lipid IV(A) lauroyltransferase [Candidatus Frackibacter sp. WG11]SEM37893.1 KDO2-lipid IV(A) lauroyltransferase [Candidatus Frackibacter sp. WG12]SFL43370.1 KDO2-lipid IV(A) lauroyltransferase [Candidatus Frackibacter sp. WG13]
MKDLIVYLLYRCLEFVVNIVPESIAYKVGKAFGNLAYILLPDRRRIAVQNLQLALNVDKEQAIALTKSNFEHLGKLLIEFLRFPQLSSDNIDELVEVEGVEYLLEAQQREEGFVIFSGHFGNWELLGAALALKGFPVNALARDQNNELINEHIISNRLSTGINIFADRGMVVRKAYQALKKGEGLFVLGDQKERDAEDFVEFFGLEVGVKLGTVNLAARTNSNIIPMYIARKSEGKHKIIVKEPLEVEKNITREAKRQVMEELYTTLEEVIREYPDQWLWAHKRWQLSFDYK